MTKGATPLFSALEQLAPHDHICSIYESQEEHFAVSIPFIRIGLDRGEKCIYIVDDGTETIVRDAMSAEGIDVERAIATNSLVLARKEAAYLKTGSFDPDWMFSFWTDAAAEATSQGFSALRATGETEWVLRGAPGLERWWEYESRLTRTLANHNCSALCQYNRNLFPAELVLNVIRTHPIVIHKGVVCRNMYHVPPEQLLDTSPAQEVERLLSTIREREEIEHKLREQGSALRQSERLLRVVLDGLPVGVAVVDLSGDLILSNPSALRIWSELKRSGSARYAESKGWSYPSGKRVAPDEWPSARALISGQTTVNDMIEIEAFDGVKRILQNSAFPIADADDNITGAVVVIEDISARSKAERELSDSYNQMRALTARLMYAQDDERRRIAQMLHETTAQDLAALKMQLARLNRTVSHLSETDRDALTESISLAEQAMTEIRTLSYLLHPPFLDEAGLASALRWYAAGFSERSGIAVDLELPERLERLPLDTETALFRIVQESLTNIHRHAQSETARIRLQRENGTLILAIEDQGRGIPADSLQHIRSGGGTAGVGIAGMSERIEQLGGRLEIMSGPEGTTVRVGLPMVRAAG